MGSNHPEEFLRPNMAYAMTGGGVYVVVHDEIDPTPDVWREYVNEMEKQAPKIRGLAVYSLGGGPKAAERRYVADMWTRVGVNPPIVLVTPVLMVRTVVTALNWFLSRPIETFPPADFDRAMDKLDLAKAERTEVRSRFSRMGQALGFDPFDAAVRAERG